MKIPLNRRQRRALEARVRSAANVDEESPRLRRVRALKEKGKEDSMTTTTAAPTPLPSGDRRLIEARQRGYGTIVPSGSRRLDDKLRNDWIVDCFANERPIVWVGLGADHKWAVGWQAATFRWTSDSNEDLGQRVLDAGIAGYGAVINGGGQIIGSRDLVTATGLFKADAVALAERIVEIAQVPRDPPPDIAGTITGVPASA